MKPGEIVLQQKATLIKLSKYRYKERKSDSQLFANDVNYVTLFIYSTHIPPEINNVKILQEKSLQQETSLRKAFLQGTKDLKECLFLTWKEKPKMNLADLFDHVIMQVKDGFVIVIDTSLSEDNSEIFPLKERQKFYIEEWTGAHPLFKSPSQIAAFPTLQKIMAVFQNMLQYEVLAKDVLSILQLPVHQSTETLKHPFIVVEGLDGTGKSTTVKMLTKHLNAHVLSTPPSVIEESRENFDKLPEVCRRAYYAFGNYIISNDIKEICRNKPVILDRYWYSTVAYAIATQSCCGVNQHLPVRAHSVYKWPDDLLKPSAVIYLYASEKSRTERLLRRKKHSSEEVKMNEDKAFTKRILAVYERLKDDSWIVVNTDQPHGQSLHTALRSLRSRGIIT